jgi:membrane protease YdiL (CAAX protease family)
MPKARTYIKNLLLFTLLVAVVFLLQKIPLFQPLGNLTARYLGDNWTAPLIFFAGVFVGSFLLKVQREEENKQKLILVGVLFVVVLFFMRYGVPHPAIKPMFSAGPYLFFCAYLEEFLFRRVGFEGLRRQEEKLYKEPMLKRLGPISFLVSCSLFGLFHGLDPWDYPQQLWSWPHYANAFDASMRYTLLYIATRTIWVPGTAHFLASMVRYLW